MRLMCWLLRKKIYGESGNEDDVHRSCLVRWHIFTH